MTAVLIEPLVRTRLRLVPAPSSEPPFDDEPGLRPVLRLVPPLPAKPGRFDEDAWLASERTPSSQLPAASTVARVLVQALLEVRAGVRPLQQLRRDTTPEVFTSLRRTIGLRPRAEGTRPDRGAIRSLHVQQRADGVAEICATVRQGHRFAALALRLEGMDGRWRCTELSGV